MINWDRVGLDAPEHIYNQLVAAEGDTIILQGDRDKDTVWSPDKHLSEETFDALMHQVRLWVGTRMVRHHDRTGKGAQHVTIEVKVTTAGPLEVGGERPGKVKLELLDGRVRVRAIEGLS